MHFPPSNCIHRKVSDVRECQNTRTWTMIQSNAFLRLTMNMCPRGTTGTLLMPALSMFFVLSWERTVTIVTWQDGKSVVTLERIIRSLSKLNGKKVQELSTLTVSFLIWSRTIFDWEIVFRESLQKSNPCHCHAIPNVWKQCRPRSSVFNQFSPVLSTDKYSKTPVPIFSREKYGFLVSTNRHFDRFDR